MSAMKNRFQSVRKHIDVFAESWKADHAEAMRCRDFEDLLAQGLMVFHYFDDLCQLRRGVVFQGLQDPIPELDEAEKECYAHWLEVSQEVGEGLAEFEKEFGTVERADEFRKCLARTQFLLAHWAPAVPARAIGSRAHDVSAEEADELHAFVKRGPERLGARPGNPSRSLPGIRLDSADATRRCLKPLRKPS
jgi:hypothetical protein